MHAKSEHVNILSMRLMEELIALKKKKKKVS